MTTKENKTAILIVGYKTKLGVPPESIELPVFNAPSNYKDEEKIKEYVAKEAAKFQAQLASTPYYATFERVIIADPAREVIQGFNWYPPEKQKPPLALRVRNWLLKHYPNAWPFDTHPGPRKPEAIILGFQTGLFLKLLGVECSMPPVSSPLPPSLWYDNRDHRDIVEAVLPGDYCKGLTLTQVLKFRGITPKEGWGGPGTDAEEDVRITVELATQLGFLDSFPVSVALAQATGAV